MTAPASSPKGMLPSPNKARLFAVPCAECGHPVCHLDRRVVGALAGGLCTRCRRDHNDRPKRVYTYAIVVEGPEA